MGGRLAVGDRQEATHPPARPPALATAKLQLMYHADHIIYKGASSCCFPSSVGVSSLRGRLSEFHRLPHGRKEKRRAKREEEKEGGGRKRKEDKWEEEKEREND